MKKLAILVVLAVVAGTGSAFADVVFDFGTAFSTGATLTTTPVTGCSAFCMSLSFDNTGNPTAFAGVDATGIFGGLGDPDLTNPMLTLGLPGGVTAFDFDFALGFPLDDAIPGVGGLIDNSVFQTANATLQTSGVATGHFHYAGPTFNRLDLLFAQRDIGGAQIDFFAVNHVTAEPVPEPATVWLLGTMLAGFGVFRLRKRA